MAIQQVNVGASPNDKTGDKLRDAFIKLNANDEDLDSRVSTAQGEAESASTAASEALSVGESAQTDATQALQNAENAQATANAAVPKVDLADPTDTAKGAAMWGYNSGAVGDVGQKGSEILGYFKSLKQFGAKGDDDSDDTDAILKAFDASAGKVLDIGPGVYRFSSHLICPSGVTVRVHPNAVFIPTWNPVGTANREKPLVLFGDGVNINRFAMHLRPGINTIRIGVEFGDNAQIGTLRMTSDDLNNNRTASGSTDDRSGAVVLSGQNIQVDAIYVSRWEKSFLMDNCSDLVVRSLTQLEHVMGLNVVNSSNCHVLQAYSTGPTNPAEPNEFRRGIMTPGANSLLLSGAVNCSFSNWRSVNALEHGIRIGSPSTLNNEGCRFYNVSVIAPYGCGFKADGGDDSRRKDIEVFGLYTEDVGHGNWFGNPDYQNWQTGGVNRPDLDNDGNKEACAIRGTRNVRVYGFKNRAVNQAQSGYYGLWVQDCDDFTGNGIDTSVSRRHGVCVQGGISINNISIQNVVSTGNGGSNIALRVTSDSVTVRGVRITDFVSSGAGEFDVLVEARPNGDSPYATTATVLQGFARSGSGPKISIPDAVLNDPDFIDSIQGYADGSTGTVRNITSANSLRPRDDWTIVTSSGAVVVTLPAQVTTAFPLRRPQKIMQASTGVVTITPASGVTLNGGTSPISTSGANSVVLVEQVSPDNWVLY